MAGMLSATSARGRLENALRERKFKYQYGHYYMGNWRFQFRPASVALTRRVGEGSTKQWCKKGWWYYGQVNYDEFCKLADKVVEVVRAAEAKARAERPATGGVGVVVTENEQKDGVEVRFAEKPEADVIQKMKDHGFRWSKFQKLWYARRSPETLEFAYSLAGKQVEIPQGPDMNAIVDEVESGGGQGPDPEDTAETSEQFKFGGHINNPEYAAGQA
jgi:hypothetical protein